MIILFRLVEYFMIIPTARSLLTESDFPTSVKLKLLSSVVFAIKKPIATSKSMGRESTRRGRQKILEMSEGKSVIQSTSEVRKTANSRKERFFNNPGLREEQ